MTAAYDVLIGVALAALMFAIAVFDWRSYRVPDALTAAALALRGVDLLVDPSGPRLDALMDASLRAAFVAALFYGFRAAYRRLRRREGLGLGDVKLAAVAGAWVDWRWLPYIVEAAALAGFALALYRARRQGDGLRGGMKLPFAVGFAPAILLGWGLSRLGV